MNVERHNLTFELEHDSELLSIDTKIHIDIIQEMMLYMVDLGLFISNNGVIVCPKMASRTDEYTNKLIKKNPNFQLLNSDFDSVGTQSEKIPPIRIEENRREENIYTDSDTNSDTSKPKSRKFKKPTVEEIAEYCKERGNNIDAEHFHSYYQTRSWMLPGKIPMKSWKHCIITWEKNAKKNSSLSNSNNTIFGADDYVL